MSGLTQPDRSRAASRKTNARQTHTHGWRNQYQTAFLGSAHNSPRPKSVRHGTVSSAGRARRVCRRCRRCHGRIPGRHRDFRRWQPLLSRCACGTAFRRAGACAHVIGRKQPRSRDCQSHGTAARMQHLCSRLAHAVGTDVGAGAGGRSASTSASSTGNGRPTRSDCFPAQQRMAALHNEAMRSVHRAPDDRAGQWCIGVSRTVAVSAHTILLCLAGSMAHVRCVVLCCVVVCAACCHRIIRTAHQCAPTDAMLLNMRRCRMRRSGAMVDDRQSSRRLGGRAAAASCTQACLLGSRSAVSTRLCSRFGECAAEL